MALDAGGTVSAAHPVQTAITTIPIPIVIVRNKHRMVEPLSFFDYHLIAQYVYDTHLQSRLIQ